MRILGIDPGLSGAMALLDQFAYSEIAVEDIPILEISCGRTSRRIISAENLASIILRLRPDHIFVENVHPMPGQGVTSSGRLMESLGIIRGVIGTLQLSRTFVEPSVWKRRMGLIGKGKDDSIALALNLFPSVDLSRKKDHNRAEALLIAEFGRREMQNGR